MAHLSGYRQAAPELQAWRERDLEVLSGLMPIHYKIKENNRYVSKTISTLLDLNIDGTKELLGSHLSDQEGAHHWVGVLTDDLYNRSVKDILIACVDGLKGFPEPLKASTLTRKSNTASFTKYATH